MTEFTPLFESIFPLVFGVILSFLGYPVYKLSIKVSGFILGFFIGITVAYFIDRYLFSLPYEHFVVAGSGLLLGLLGAMSMNRWIKLLLFVGGFSMGMVIARGSFIGQEVFPAIPALAKINDIIPGVNLMAILLAVAIGVTAIFLEKFFVILFTCFWGARLVSTQIINPYIFPAVLFSGILFQVWILSRRATSKSVR